MEGKSVRLQLAIAQRGLSLCYCGCCCCSCVRFLVDLRALFEATQCSEFCISVSEIWGLKSWNIETFLIELTTLDTEAFALIIEGWLMKLFQSCCCFCCYCWGSCRCCGDCFRRILVLFCFENELEFHAFLGSFQIEFSWSEKLKEILSTAR